MVNLLVAQVTDRIEFSFLLWQLVCYFGYVLEQK